MELIDVYFNLMIIEQHLLGYRVVFDAGLTGFVLVTVCILHRLAFLGLRWLNCQRMVEHLALNSDYLSAQVRSRPLFSSAASPAS